MASKELEGFGKSLGGLGTLGKVAALGVAGVAAAGAGLVAGIGASINEAMNFEAAMSAVGAVAGASASEMQALSDTAIQLGQDTTLSGVGATDAARAMRELAAAGMTVQDIVGGGALGALRLASAGGIDVAQSAEIAAMALANFGLAGSQATMVADLFASAANSSAISVTDIAETMKYVGPVAKSMGLSIEEVTATIAALGNQGIKGSQAGTSLRSMIVSLAKPSKEATKVMNGLGLSFFDGAGKMKDLAGISQELKTKMSGLTDKQRASALATLFGNEALTAATVLYGEGADGINKWLKEVTTGATAAEVGAARNNNLKGSIEALKSSLQTAAIVLGQAFLPSLKNLADMAAQGVSAAIPLIQAWGPRLVAGLQSAIGVISSLGGYVASAIGSIMGAFQALQSGQITLSQFIGGLKSLIGVVVGDIGTMLGNVVGFLAPYFTAIVGAITSALPVVAAELLKLGQAFGSWIIDTAIPFLATNLPLWLTALGTWVTGTALPAIAGFVGGIGAAFGGWVQSTAIPYLTTNLPLWLTAISTWLTTTGIPGVVTAASGIGAAFGGWIAGTAIPYLTTNLPLWLTAITDWVTNTALPAVQNRLSQFATIFGDWIAQATVYVSTNLPLWMEAITTWISGTALPAIQNRLMLIAAVMSDWVPQAVVFTQTNLPLWSDAITNYMTTTVGLMKAVEQPLADALAGWILDAISVTWTNLDTWSAALVSYIPMILAASIPALWPALAIMLAKWIDDPGHAETKAALARWGAMIGPYILFVTLPAVGFAVLVGKALGEGIAKGLLEMLETVGTAAHNLANWVIEKIREALGVNSPSTLTTAMGKDVGQGLANGISSMLGAVLSAAINIATGAIGAMQSAVAGGAALMFTAGKNLVQGFINGIDSLLGAAKTKAAELAGISVQGVTQELKEKSPSRVMFDVGVNFVQGLINGMDEKQGEAAKKAADIASAVAKAITDTLAALKALASFDFAKNSPSGEAMGWFRHLTESMIATMAEAGKNFKEETLKQTSAFADTVGKVGGAVKNAVDGLAAIGTAKWADISPSGSAMGWFTLLMTSLVRNFADAAKGFDEDALKAASGLAETAGKIGGSIKNTLDGLAALASAKWADTSPSGSAMAWFASLVAALVQNFATVAAAFDAEILAATNRFAETAGKVAGVIGPALAGFKELATIVAPSQTSIDQLIAGIKYLVMRFGEMAATMAAEGVKAMGDFSDATNKALGAAKTGTDLFKSFDKLVIPSAKAIDNLANGIRYVIAKFREMAGEMQTEGIAQMQTFAGAAGQVLAAAKSGTDLFASMDKLAVPSAAAIDYLLGSMGYVIQQTRAIANGIGTEGLAQAQAFATGTLNVFTIIKTALDQFAKLTDFKDIPTKALDALFKALEETLSKAGDLVARSDALKEAALEFLANMTAAAAAYQKGNGMAIGGPALAAPAGVGGGGGGGGQQGPKGDVYNLNMNGPVYGMADFQDVVVGTMEEAGRRGRT